MCPIQTLAFVSSNVISNDCCCCCLFAVDCTLNRYAPADWDVIVLSQGNARGEDCWRVFKWNVTVSFCEAVLITTLAWYMFRQGIGFCILRIFFKLWMPRQHWGADCLCSHFKISSDSFRFLVQLLANFCDLVGLNYASKQRLFLDFGLKTLRLMNIKQILQITNLYMHQHFTTDPRLNSEKSLCHRRFVCLKVFACVMLVTMLMLEVSMVQCRPFPSLSVGLPSPCGLEETTYRLPWWIAVNLSSLMKDTEDLRLRKCWRLISISSS